MKKYQFKPYDPSFPNLYEKEKKRLAQLLEGDYQIEHIGSTAIPDLGGKGIIDIMIAVSKDKMKDYSTKLKKAGYKYLNQTNVKERLFHWQDIPDGKGAKRRYHIHLTYPEGSDFKNAIIFRDYLKTHPKDLKRYADTKREAAIKAHEDTETYMQIKEDVLNYILKKAIKN